MFVSLCPHCNSDQLSVVATVVETSPLIGFAADNKPEFHETTRTLQRQRIACNNCNVADITFAAVRRHSQDHHAKMKAWDVKNRLVPAAKSLRGDALCVFSNMTAGDNDPYRLSSDSGTSVSQTRRLLGGVLADKGLVTDYGDDNWTLTDLGHDVLPLVIDIELAAA